MRFFLKPRSTPKDSIEICFIFFRVVLYFLRIFEVYTNFWKYNQKRKIRRKKNHRTVLVRLRPMGLALLAWPMTISAWPASRWRDARVTVTTRGAATVVRLARLTGGVPFNEVLPTTTGALPRDGRARWGGWALTEAMWHR
jgi:hypothetical protein